MEKKLRQGMVFETIEFSGMDFYFNNLVGIPCKRLFTYELSKKNHYRLPLDYRVLSRLIVKKIK